MAIVFNKLFCSLKERNIFRTQIKKIFGIGSKNIIYRKFGLTRNARTYNKNSI